MGLPWWLSGKESARKSGDSDLIPGLERSPGEGNGNPRKSGDSGLIPGLERSPGEGNGNPLQYSCLGNPTNKRAWQAIVHKVTKSRT